MKISGKTIAITSASGHSPEAYRKLRKLGADVLSKPLVKITGRKLTVPEADAYVFTSIEGVRAVLEKLGKDKFSKLIGKRKIFAIGPFTAEAIRKLGLRPYVPKKYHSFYLAKLILKSGAKSAVAFRSSRPGREIKDGLRGKIKYTEIIAYGIEPVKRRVEADVIFVTSATAAKALPKSTALLVSIGPHTSKALKSRRLGHIEAKRHTLDGMITALKRAKNVTA